MAGEVSIRCAFCHGKGKDPFGILSYLSTCCVCGGMGTHQVREPHVPCAFCQSSGVYPRSRLTCTACRGLGVRPVEAPRQPCPQCRGTGGDLGSETGFYCLGCHGAGVVAA